jgi:dTMP kinase
MGDQHRAGLLIAVEGPKLVGKTTLVNELKQRTSETGEWVFTKEPTERFDLGNEQRLAGTELAERIAEDRRSHVDHLIAPALRAGQVVVTDRYVLSSYVFHCLDRVEPAVIAELNWPFPRPDLLVILLCSPMTLEQRRARRGRQTRLGAAITPEQEMCGYLTYASRVRPPSEKITLWYNESMKDSRFIADALIAETQTLVGRHA